MKLKPNHFSSIQGSDEITRGNGRKYTIRKHRDRFFFPDEWVAFYNNLKAKQEFTFNFLLNTGARIMEAQNVQVKDIDLDRGVIILRITKRIVNRPGKGKVGERKVRVVTISSKFVRYMRAFINKRKLKSEDKFPVLSCAGANIALKVTLKRVGIKDYKMFSVHNVRKTTEMWLLTSGFDGFRLAKQMGHSAQIAFKHYLSPDVFSFEEKQRIKDILGEDVIR